jgi:hypothetical protein
MNSHYTKAERVMQQARDTLMDGHDLFAEHLLDMAGAGIWLRDRGYTDDIPSAEEFANGLLKGAPPQGDKRHADYMAAMRQFAQVWEMPLPTEPLTAEECQSRVWWHIAAHGCGCGEAPPRRAELCMACEDRPILTWPVRVPDGVNPAWEHYAAWCAVQGWLVGMTSEQYHTAFEKLQSQARRQHALRPIGELHPCTIVRI